VRYLPLLLLIAACSDSASSPPPPPPPPPALQSVGDFEFPVFATSPAGDTARLFVVERTGVIRIVKSGATLATPFLDLHTKLPSSDELGMFSMAFHPQYATNGHFYVFYTDSSSNLRIVRYTVSANPDVADETTADTVLKVVHGGINHHGGQLDFGPDGKLYIGIGDGGCCGDPNGHGQGKHTLLGKLLRLNVDVTTGYTIPADNPFATDTTAEPEIWAYGLRNPWRFSFDRLTGDLYIGDVGQDMWEEVDAAAAPNAGKGRNYGWSIMEGTHCFNGPCPTAGLTPPVLEYQHAGGACDVQGGYVYRGTAVRQLTGQYLYADYCTNVVSSFTWTGGPITGRRNWPALTPPSGLGIVSFGEDARGEVYIMTYTGTLYRIVEGQ
jgi:glucose/arabinose dehydrogenase